MINKNILLLLLNIITCYGMEDEYVKVWDVNENRKTLSTYLKNNPCTPTEQTILGYNPNITFVPNKDRAIVHQGITVWCHGFGGGQENAKDIQRYNKGELPSDIVTFNFPDAQLQDNITAITKSSFGQKTEILPTIWTLNKVVEAGQTKIDFNGISRAATSMINTLAALVRPSDKIDRELQRLFIDSSKRYAILEALQKGTVTFWWPLRDIEHVIKSRIDEGTEMITNASIKSVVSSAPTSASFFSWISTPLSWSRGISTEIIKASVINVSMPVVTSYKPWNETVDKSLTILQDKKEFKTITFYQPNDQAVTNDGEGNFVDRLPSAPEHTYVVPGNSGGHVQSDDHQIVLLNLFRQQYGRSYDKNMAALFNAEALKKAQVFNINTVQGKTTQQFLDEYNKFSLAEKIRFW